MSSDLSAVCAAMSVRDLQKELRERGVNTASCIEKADLVRLLLTNWDTEARPQPQPAAMDSSADGDVSAQQGRIRKLKFSCEACGKAHEQLGNAAGGKLLRCSRCNGPHYCSKACQVADWPAHKSLCQKRQTADKSFADSAGMEVAAAYVAWLRRFEQLIVEAAAKLLWPAPHLPPRNRSHGLLLYVPYDNSAVSGQAVRGAHAGGDEREDRRVQSWCAGHGGGAPLAALSAWS